MKYLNKLPTFRNQDISYKYLSLSPLTEWKIFQHLALQPWLPPWVHAGLATSAPTPTPLLQDLAFLLSRTFPVHSSWLTGALIRVTKHYILSTCSSCPQGLCLRAERPIWNVHLLNFWSLSSPCKALGGALSFPFPTPLPGCVFMALI